MYVKHEKALFNLAVIPSLWVLGNRIIFDTQPTETGKTYFANENEAEVAYALICKALRNGATYLDLDEALAEVHK